VELTLTQTSFELDAVVDTDRGRVEGRLGVGVCEGIEKLAPATETLTPCVCVCVPNAGPRSSRARWHAWSPPKNNSRLTDERAVEDQSVFRSVVLGPVQNMLVSNLIAHAGSLISLAKQPASTIQILGAEKALFRALK
jgi:hypothetical protein